MAELLPFVLVLSLSWLLALALVAYGHRSALLAMPNSRSSHSVPTPTSGGIAILVSYLGFICWRQFSLEPLSFELTVVSGLGGLIGLLGLLDDRVHIASYWRLLIHFIAAALLVKSFDSLPALSFFGWMPDSQLLIACAYAVGIVWLINLFNFMDGIDGIAGIEAVAVLLGASFILWLRNLTGEVDYLIALAFCVGGFLVLNWAPAKLFMGDIGSGFLGIMLGGFALVTAASGAISLWSWVILLAVFVCDATVTLLRRGMRGEKVYQAHRSHAYQILSRRWGSHSRVSLLVLVVNVFWLFPLAVLCTYLPQLEFAMTILAYSPLIVAVIKIGAGTSND